MGIGMTLSASVKIKDKVFQLISSFIYDQVGIQLPYTKKTMLEARLQKRLKHLGLDSFEAYCEHVFSPAGKQNEMVHMIDAVTTNKTDFFREPGHFQYLTNSVLPSLNNGHGQHMRLWSAGCSSGEEPYTLAMVLSEYAAEHQHFDFSILASDISTRILATAKAAIYSEDRINDIAMHIRKKYLLRSRDRHRGLVRIRPELRAKIVFRRINFMEPDFRVAEKMDIIFCRNVVIYFDKPTQQNLMRKFYNQLRPGGYLFLGHSETLNGINADFTTAGSTVYQKT